MVKSAEAKLERPRPTSGRGSWRRTARCSGGWAGTRRRSTSGARRRDPARHRIPSHPARRAAAADAATADASAAGGPNLYSLLITAYLRPAEGEPMLRELHDLLQTERARLDPVEVMSALPTGAAAHPHRWQHSTHCATLATHRATLCRAHTLPPAVGGCHDAV